MCLPSGKFHHRPPLSLLEGNLLTCVVFFDTTGFPNTGHVVDFEYYVLCIPFRKSRNLSRSTRHLHFRLHRMSSKIDHISIFSSLSSCWCDSSFVSLHHHNDLILTIHDQYNGGFLLFLCSLFLVFRSVMGRCVSVCCLFLSLTRSLALSSSWSLPQRFSPFLPFSLYLSLSLLLSSSLSFPLSLCLSGLSLTLQISIVSLMFKICLCRSGTGLRCLLRNHVSVTQTSSAGRWVDRELDGGITHEDDSHVDLPGCASALALSLDAYVHPQR